MNHFFLALFALLFSTAHAATPAGHSYQDWEVWKEKRHKKHTTSETSYLNATGVSFLKNQGELFLNREKTQWSRNSQPGFLAKVFFNNGKAFLERAGEKKIEVKQDKVEWTLENGIIARVLRGKSKDRIWAYTYDPGQIKRFTGFRYFPYNKRSIIKGQLHRSSAKKVDFKTYQKEERKVSVIGTVAFEYDGEKFELPAYNWQKPGEPIKYAALIFTEPTAPKFTYGGGRELVIDLDPKVTEKTIEVTLDFNRTFNFYCAHSPYWHCPVGLDTKISKAFYAGEMLPKKKIVSR